jgi:eukaryotic-like serine/threonine-protein kinase
MSARWNDIEAVLRAALTRASDERAAFVAAACAGDSDLRREVESLLARETATNQFLSTPAVALLAATEETAVFIGREFGAYTIVDLLGSGGMGQVYRARDRQLDRDVAIKILPPLFTRDEDRLIRFEREAKILAALNHPHIGAIYGLERVDPSTGSGPAVPALVLELVEGPTLAERLLDGPLTSRDAVAIATQIADALEVAHRQGIIHRDLKPANIKVTASGFVKLLDFGLAKGVGHDDSRAVSGAVAASPTTSRPGAIMGTAAYMSPEQARGEPVDARSDLFSLGAVIYEMVTGRPPFSGATSSAILNAILNETPSSPRTINPHVPVSLERVVMRLLTKDRVARPQSASVVRTELQRVTRELEAHTHRWRRRWVRVGGVAAAALLLAFGIWAARRPVPAAVANREYPQMTHFADSATQPALSSDGRLLTFIRGSSTFNGRGQIYIKTLPDGEPIPLTSDNVAKMSPVFSPDDSTIAYTVVTSQFNWDTWTVAARGGEARPWVQNASGLVWHRDGRLLFSEMTAGLHMRIAAADEQRKARQVVYSPAGEYGMAHRSAVSPDGAWVLVAEMDSPLWEPCRLVPSNGQSTGRKVGPDGQCTSAAWSPDGRWMYFSANSTGAYHLWRQRFPDGTPEQLTYGPTEEEGIAPAPDGRSILTSVGTRHQSLWIEDERGEREVSREGYAFIPAVPGGATSQPLPGDGRSVFYLVRQGAVRFSGAGGERAGELWATELETGRHRSILPGRSVIGYDVSRDGRQIVFAELDQRGSSRLWLTRLDRPDAPRRLAEFEADSPRFDAGGDIFFRGMENGRRFVYRLREGHVPEKVIQRSVLFFQTVSPDGAWVIAKVEPADRRDGFQVDVAFPLSGDPPIPLCQCEVDWTPNGRSLVIRLTPTNPAAPGRTILVPLEPGSMLPSWPARAIRSPEDVKSLRPARVLSGWVYPTDSGSAYVFTRSTIQRNIHRVPLP